MAQQILSDVIANPTYRGIPLLAVAELIIEACPAILDAISQDFVDYIF